MKPRVSMLIVYKDANNYPIRALYRFKEGEHLTDEMACKAILLRKEECLNWGFAEELQHPGALAQNKGLIAFPTDDDGDYLGLPEDGLSCSCAEPPPLAAVEQEVDCLFAEFLERYERRQRAGTAHPGSLANQRIRGEL
jgi:hypothetical protein